jgi:foldase protein PrsA
MKKTAVMTLIAALAVLAAASCSTKTPEGAKLVKDSPAYKLAKDLAAITPEFDPDRNAVLVTAKSFAVSAGDVIEVIQGTMGNNAAQLKSMPAAQLKTALGRAAVQVGERKLLLEAAARAGVVVTDEEFRQVLERQAAGAGGEAAFVESLKGNGVDPEAFKKTLADDQRIQKYVETKVFAAITVGEEDLKKAYAEDKTVTLRHILLMTQDKPEAEKPAIRKKMESVLERARKGEDFAALATELTEDPGSKDKGGLYEDVKAKLAEDLKSRLQMAAYGKLLEELKAAAGFKVVAK